MHRRLEVRRQKSTGSDKHTSQVRTGSLAELHLQQSPQEVALLADEQLQPLLGALLKLGRGFHTNRERGELLLRPLLRLDHHRKGGREASKTLFHGRAQPGEWA